MWKWNVQPGHGPMRHARRLALAALLVVAPALSGCYVEDGPPPPEYAEGYQPQYYDGYVVYYDAVGRPYYYVNGGVYWVPPASPLYIGLVNHWRYYRPAYHRWYAHYGARYRGYRYPAYRR
ncbi:MAG TPA: hypothetical protein VE987_11540 [Polyangiaceae bacterium]|nr:hypothetical protein [Polyangiaceae bacterium]